jgi:hypothetical protein
LVSSGYLFGIFWLPLWYLRTFLFLLKLYLCFTFFTISL